ncbi:MAG: M1 family metallopeptidase, partial [Candidatus Eremiobacteraeota bacterium]|nr:M1 family metallopeptidase [Candidatus Eremiobacteraeota bacterium]
MRGFWTALLLFVLAAPAAAFDFDATPGSLPKTIVPSEYTFAVTPDAASQTFTGTERVALRVRKPTSRVVFNTLNLRLHAVRIDGRSVARVITDNNKQTTTLILAHPLTAGAHVMTVTYDGKMNRGPEGMFSRSYRNAAGSGVMVTTQLESTAARRLFPSWDEPAFRATYIVSVTIPSGWTAVSNMPVARRVVRGSTATVTFQRTPNMPTYLVQFTAGDLRDISEMHDGIRHTVWAVRGQEQQGRYALKNSEQILDDFNRYYGFRYPLPKLDSIAIPGGFPGAMENWGAITYNDQLMLTGSTTPIALKQFVFDVQAHEMSHQWLGDLVTLDWWSDVFVNESFASWMETKETAFRNPSWQWWELRDADKDGAMDKDAQPTSPAVIMPVKNVVEAEANFDPAIVYAKGGYVLRMFEEYLTPDIFRDGVRRFVRAHAYSNANGHDFWVALSAASGQDMTKIGEPWIMRPGYPVVSVRAVCDSSGKRTLTLSQRRFLWSGTDSANTSWSVPMQIRSGNGPIQRVILHDDGQMVDAGTCDQPLTANASGFGFYRVAYDAQTLATNAKAFASFGDPDKIAMLDDQWAFARSGASDLAPYLQFAANMGSDYDARAWEQITTALATLEHDERGLPDHDTLELRARALVNPVLHAIGWSPKPGEAPPVADLRKKVLISLGQWGDPAVIAEARRQFAIFDRNRSSLSVDQQNIVLAIVAEYADAATFARLHAIARTARDTSQVGTFYAALVGVRDPRLAKMALDALLTDPIPPQAKHGRLRFVTGSDEEGIAGAADQNPRLAWSFFKAHYKELSGDYGSIDEALSVSDYLPR